MLITLLASVALLTATISAIVGMGGGMLLLATLFACLPHAEAIPVHASVQLVSNSTRTLTFLRHVHWPTLGRFLIGVLPGSLLGLGLLVWLGQPQQSEPWFKCLVGAYILGSLLLPKPRPVSFARVWWDFPLLGVLAGTAAFTVGAVGPLIAPLFARRNFVKERLVATKAVCQSFVHLAKIPGFLYVFYSTGYERLPATGIADAGNDDRGHPRHATGEASAEARLGEPLCHALPRGPARCRLEGAAA